MKRWIALALVGLMLAVPVASAASFTDLGNGPQRTGRIDFQGPQTNDTAFEVELPGISFGKALLIEDALYVVTVPNESKGYTGDTDNLTESALWRIDIQDATVERVMDLPEGLSPVNHGLLSPKRLLLTDGQDLIALAVPSGEELWRNQAIPEDPRDYRRYGDPILMEGTLYVGFTAYGAQEEDVTGAGYSQGTETVLGVWAVDPETGENRWNWTRPSAGPNPTEVRPASTETSLGTTPIGFALSADEDRVYPYIYLYQGYGSASGLAGERADVEMERRTYELAALDASNGGLLWATNDTPRRGAAAESTQGSVDRSTLPGQCCAFPVATETSAYTRLDVFKSLNPADGGEIWRSEAGRSDHVNFQGATGMGIRGDTFIGTSPQTVYRLDAAESGDIVWQDTSTDQTYANEPIILDRDTAYVPIHPIGDDNFLDIGFEARDLETGEVVWRWEHHPEVGYNSSIQDSSNPVFGPGVVVWPAKDGTVTVVGETEASLGEPDVPEQMYPGVGNETTLDASGAEPGAFGNATRYMVDWGDGTLSGWQSDPIFSHTYNESGEFEAQVYAGNDANQTSSTFVTMNVGQEPPVEPNWISERFDPENQEMTFGVLGIALALGGGAIGIARRRRKRSNLERELEALEQGFEETRDTPGECEALLDNRKARARSLALDGHLEEQQVSIVENRAEELRAGLRVEALEDRFGYLPYNLVTKARQMVEDGTVTALERDAFLRALEEDEVLTSQQKATVRERIEQWFARDAGGGGAG